MLIHPPCGKSYSRGLETLALQSQSTKEVQYVVINVNLVPVIPERRVIRKQKEGQPKWWEGD